MERVNGPVPFGSATIERDVAEIARRARNDLNALRGKSVLVTGGAGFLLSYLVDVLAAEGARVVVADNFTTGIPLRLAHWEGKPAVRFLKVDASKPFDPGGPVDVVVHGASIASPITYRKHPLRTAEVNALGTYHLLQAFAGEPLQSFVLMSTSEIYGDPDPASIPTPEAYRGFVSCTGPRACYDESKRFSETLAVLFHQEHGVPTRMIRPFNVYGPGMRLDDGRVLPDFATCALRGEDIVLLSDGTPTRSFCYVTDFIVGLLAVMVRGKAGEPYNVGSDRQEVSMRDLAQLVSEVGGRGGKLRFARSEDQHYLTDNPQRRGPSLAGLRALGGFELEVDLREGIGRYLAWARESGELARVGKERK